MKKIFVSRKLKPDSPIIKVASGYDIHDQSLIEFSPLAFEAPNSDWIFFYSRNGVKYFFEQSNFELYPYLYACMSEGTADELSKYVLDISFVGEGSPDQVAQQFESIKPASETVTYIRALYSINSIKNLMDEGSSISIPVYRNVASQAVPADNFDILIFSSPLNVDAFFSKNQYKNQEVITIGSTTAAALQKYKVDKVTIAGQPSEDGVAEALSKVLSKA